MIYEAIDYWNSPPGLYLQHYGVKGMKWGIRKRIDTFKANHRARVKKRNDAYRQKMYNKTKEYKAYYKNASDAEIQKERRAKIARNVALGVGVVAGVALGAYFVDRYRTQHMDETIKAGKVLQYVGNHNNFEEGKKFYAAHNWQDKIKYMGMFGKNGAFNNTTETYKNIYAGKVKDNIKVLGIDNGRKMFDSLAKQDPGIKKHWKNYENFNTMGLLGPGYKEQKKFFGMPEKADDEASKYINSFINLAKSKGYSAIADYNDRVNSGYNAKAVIVLDGMRSKFTNITVNKLNDKKYKKAHVFGVGLAYKDLLKIPVSKAIGVGAGATAAAITVNSQLDRDDRQRVYSSKKYRNNTKNKAKGGNSK